jgi:hypothetical protein
MIDIYATAGTFTGEHQLAADLATAAMTIEQVPGIPPAELLAIAQQAHARITMIPGAPHLSMISDPGTITRVILAAVHATT